MHNNDESKPTAFSFVRALGRILSNFPGKWIKMSIKLKRVEGRGVRD